jgi:hypothetical protein
MIVSIEGKGLKIVNLRGQMRKDILFFSRKCINMEIVKYLSQEIWFISWQEEGVHCSWTEDDLCKKKVII